MTRDERLQRIAFAVLAFCVLSVILSSMASWLEEGNVASAKDAVKTIFHQYRNADGNLNVFKLF